MAISLFAFVAPSSAATGPTIVQYTVSPTSLPSSGGSIFIQGLVGGTATSCTLYSVPALPGLPQVQDCTAGSASASITVPGNTANQSHSYFVYLSAMGTTNTGTSSVGPAPIKVTVAGVPHPSVTNFTATPTSLPPTGGTVHLSVNVTAASTCEFYSHPSLPGLPTVLPCSGGTASTSVNVPANSTALPISYFFYIKPAGQGWPIPTPFPLGVVVNVPPPPGYWLLGSDGGVFAFGSARFYGSTGNITLNAPVVGMAPTPDGGGYWLVAKDGGVFTYGDAHFYGSMGATPLNSPVVGMAVTPDGLGYWLVGKDGGVFAFGDATYWGGTANQPLLSPIIGMATDPATGGYWLAAANGGVFTFHAAFYTNPGGLTNADDITSTVSGNGYWILTKQGTVHGYGAAPKIGSATGAKATAAGLASADNSTGYDIAFSNGAVVSFGGATFLGDLSTLSHLNAPIIGITTNTP